MTHRNHKRGCNREYHARYLVSQVKKKTIKIKLRLKQKPYVNVA